MPHHRTSGRTDASKAETARHQPRTCNKSTSRDRKFSPGISSCVCPPHGICWGFSITGRYDGPSTSFDVLVRRFPEAPDMVIYDNA